jgi:hypothetical protein
MSSPEEMPVPSGFYEQYLWRALAMFEDEESASADSKKLAQDARQLLEQGQSFTSLSNNLQAVTLKSLENYKKHLEQLNDLVVLDTITQATVRLCSSK